MAKYVWFSNGTDVTGKELARQLEATGVKTKPTNLRAGDLVVCWGTKTDEAVRLAAGVFVLNHPDKIRINRDKMAALRALVAVGALAPTIAAFLPANEISAAVDRGRMTLPIIGRKSHHQGGKGFWLCVTKPQVVKAIEAGADYFQKYIDIKDEYRLHIFRGEMIHAVKKVENPSNDAWVSQRKDMLKEMAGDRDLNEETMDFILGKLVKEYTLPDYVIRSNKRGWKFSTANNPPAALRTAAINALAALGLDFGAVDCAIDISNRPYLIEVNSGPGLQGVALERYVASIRAWATQMERPAPVPRRAPAREEAPAPARARRAAVGAANADVSDDDALALLRVADNDEDRRNILRLLRRNRG